MVGHCLVDTASSFQADEDGHFLAAHSAEARQKQRVFHLGCKSWTCIIAVRAVSLLLSLFICQTTSLKVDNHP